MFRRAGRPAVCCPGLLYLCCFWNPKPVLRCSCACVAARWEDAVGLGGDNQSSCVFPELKSWLKWTSWLDAWWKSPDVWCWVDVVASGLEVLLVDGVLMLQKSTAQKDERKGIKPPPVMINLFLLNEMSSLITVWSHRTSSTVLPSHLGLKSSLISISRPFCFGLVVFFQIRPPQQDTSLRKLPPCSVITFEM